MAAPKNRVLALLQSATLNGMDYVEVREAEPTKLYVHFHNDVPVDEPGLVATITGGDRTPTVPVGPIQAGDWATDAEGRPILTLHVPDRGDFSTYTLAIDGGTKLDPYFRRVRFSFYAFCPSLVDCHQDPEPCPEPDDAFPPIDYLAKDFESFDLALSDFSAQRFPEWRERAEADLGVMLKEALSAIGDDLSYVQDRLHQQATFETATERRALVRLARLVDYEPRPATCARTLLQCQVAATLLPAGVPVTAYAPDGSRVPFEIGTGLRDATQYRVDPRWNALAPYWWDDDDRCLGPGTTSMYIEGEGHGFFAGQRLLVDTAGPTTADEPVRELITLAAAEELTDPLYGADLTRITWRADDAFARHHDLTRTVVRGNLVPATQGRRYAEHFAIQTPPAADPGMPLAVARLGPNSTAAAPRWQYLHTLQHAPLAYLERDDASVIEPEIILTRAGAVPAEWRWARSLLETGRFEEKFTIDPAAWRPIMQTPDGTVYDYDGSDGATIRFGDGTFGELPNDGDVFLLRYRTCAGQVGNVTADTITDVDPAWAGILLAATNPFGATGGSDAETDEQIRRRAPQAFRTVTYRAVRPEDYDAAASRLPWVQRAGTVFRWTGSWPTIFTTADPRNAGAISRDEHVELTALLNRYRLAGYECYAPAPRYVSLDIQIQVCAKPDAFRGDVIAGLRRALSPARRADGTTGFFHVDNFTLGTPFERSRLEAAIQDVPGVAGVLSITYRRRGQLATYAEMPPEIKFAPGEIFRLDDDANHPERGAFRLRVEGGK